MKKDQVYKEQKYLEILMIQWLNYKCFQAKRNNRNSKTKCQLHLNLILEWVEEINSKQVLLDMEPINFSLDLHKDLEPTNSKQDHQDLAVINFKQVHQWVEDLEDHLQINLVQIPNLSNHHNKTFKHNHQILSMMLSLDPHHY